MKVKICQEKMGLFGLMVVCMIALASCENRLAMFELECRADLKAGDPCMKACIMEKMGVMRNGYFDSDLALLKIDENYGLTTKPVHDKFRLVRAMVICEKDLFASKDQDKCLLATAMYYCLNTRAQPEALYWKGLTESYGLSLNKDPSFYVQVENSARGEMLHRFDRSRPMMVSGPPSSMPPMQPMAPTNYVKKY